MIIFHVICNYTNNFSFDHNFPRSYYSVRGDCLLEYWIYTQVGNQNDLLALATARVELGNCISNKSGCIIILSLE